MDQQSNGRNFSNEQVEIIERMKHCKDYYEILSVPRDASESTLKKKYYEMALKLHPDKCKAHGATEAFKALGNAYGVLSDPEKRKDYDKYGLQQEGQPEAAHPHRRFNHFSEFDVARGFEAEMSAEDIFESFFGGGIFTPSALNRRPAHFNRHQHRTREQQPREGVSLIFQLLQMLPIIVIIFGGLIANFFGEDPAYLLNRDSTFCVQRYSQKLRVPYYVKPNFDAEHGKNLRQVEQRAESDYISMLRINCNRERNQREGLLWTARMRGDADMWKKATETELPHCKRLEAIYR